MDNEPPQQPSTPSVPEPTPVPSPIPTPPPAPTPTPPQQPRKPWLIVTLCIVIIILFGVIGWLIWQSSTKAPVATTTQTTQTTTEQTPTTQQPVQGQQLDVAKNYGNKYSNNLLPVGDGKYVTTSPKQGYVYACSQYAHNLTTDSGGASVRGPWFTNNNTQYDMSKKVKVSGSVSWHGSFSNTVKGDTRTITTNDLPVSDPTGVFPIKSSDAAYQYDRNPNTIQAQTITYSFPTAPTYNETPNCESGTVGIMLTGVELNNGFDAGGRDAGAWEVQDGCSGHPQAQGEYHYHTLSSCIKDTSVHTVIGFALDGFPITGPTVGPNNILTTADLDECHGIVSSVTLDGQTTTMYHYVMTQDFPYSVSCFRGTPMELSAPAFNAHR